MTAPELRQFITGLVCLRCHEAIAPGSPPDAELCGDCQDDLRQDDDGLDAIREYAERAAGLPDPNDEPGAGERDVIDDSEIPW